MNKNVLAGEQQGCLFFNTQQHEMTLAAIAQKNPTNNIKVCKSNQFKLKVFEVSFLFVKVEFNFAFK